MNDQRVRELAMEEPKTLLIHHLFKLTKLNVSEFSVAPKSMENVRKGMGVGIRTLEKLATFFNKKIDKKVFLEHGFAETGVSAEDLYYVKDVRDPSKCAPDPADMLVRFFGREEWREKVHEAMSGENLGVCAVEYAYNLKFETESRWDEIETKGSSPVFVGRFDYRMSSVQVRQKGVAPSAIAFASPVLMRAM
jgi:hypothetical protein